MNKRQISIRTILVSLFLLLMIFPMIVITLVNYQKETGVFQNQVSQLLLQTVRQTHHTLDANLSEIDRLTWPLLYSNSLQFISEPLDSVYQVIQATQTFRDTVYMELFRGQMNHIRSIYFITSNHTILNTESPFVSMNQINQHNYSYIQERIKENPLQIHWFGEQYAVIASRDTFNSSVHASVLAARKVLDRNNVEPLGTLFIQLNDRFIYDVLQNVQIGKTGSLILLDSSGSVIYQQDSDLLQNPEVMAEIRELPNQLSGTMSVDKKWLFAYETSKISGWKLIALVPLEELTVPYQPILQGLLLLAGAGTIISIFVSFALARAISRPVVKLAELMSTAAQGNLDVRVTPNGFKELATLQDSFNLLMERITELISTNEREQREKREAVLRALQTQIHPHFLYNTLDTIYWMAKKYKAETISRLVTALGRFFRLSLQAGQEWTTVDKEFEHIRHYLEIQSFRFRNQITYELHLEESVRDCAIMPLILQPLVENALEHGILHTNVQGIIIIEAKHSDHEVVISVRDNGRGMDQVRLTELRKEISEGIESDHVGLRNVHQRLVMAFGPSYGIELASIPFVETTVMIRIPTNELSI